MSEAAGWNSSCVQRRVCDASWASAEGVERPVFSSRSGARHSLICDERGDVRVQHSCDWYSCYGISESSEEASSMHTVQSSEAEAMRLSSKGLHLRSTTGPL